MIAIKAQALADFIAEFTYYITPELEVILPEVEASKEQNPNENLVKWKLFVDGSPNQHGCSARLVLQTQSGEQMEYATNSEAEYEALLAGLRVATELGVESLDAFSYSQLVINQVQGDDFTKDHRMVAYLDKVKNMSIKIKDFKMRQIPRDENKKAYTLANLASAFDFISDRSIPMEFFPKPSIEIAKTSVILKKVQC